MGQTLTKIKIPTPKSLTALQSKYNKLLLDEVKSDIRSKQKRASQLSSPYTDANALEGGFKRGAEKTVREVQQEEFLKGAAGGSGGAAAGMQEMPEDLIKFLNEAGPVQRQVDKTQTSPRLYETLQKEEEQRALRESSSSSSSSSISAEQVSGKDKRTRRRMPMVEGLEEEGEEEENGLKGGEVEDKTYAMMTTTERTTNFSNAKMKKEEEDDDPYNVRLSNEEICQLLHLNHDGTTTITEGKAAAVSPVAKLANIHENAIMSGGGPITPQMLRQAERSAQTHLDSLLPSTSTSLTPEQETQVTNTKTAFQNTLLHTSIPILMKDTDGTLIGVWENRLEEMSLRQLEVLDLESGVVRLTVENGGVGFGGDGGKEDGDEGNKVAVDGVR
uniref:Uncharacterized protein n=1 Tax=Helicotheca tamesis TaxID=374047 RepID=A0A7S2IBG6_9STRA|mmetsp:Transcript_7647/g.10429  ORF Transcript_7647/g.10429 Transcript_7647/m.10429 type:complete len:388 (+) Transcript_7647:166-1329(+)